MVGRNISEVISQDVLNEIQKNREYIDNEACVRNDLREPCNVLLTAKSIEDMHKEQGKIYIMKSFTGCQQYCFQADS